MGADEKDNVRIYSPSEVFGGGTFRHQCLMKCGNTLVVPDRNTPGAKERLEDGDIWRCKVCGALHEYYLAHGRGFTDAIVRLLKGQHKRAGYEPKIDEFMEKK